MSIGIDRGSFAHPVQLQGVTHELSSAKLNRQDAVLFRQHIAPWGVFDNSHIAFAWNAAGNFLF